ncbi:MAG: hypothetical protein DWH86_03585 [Planctomycetota bacterium]|nr:MAG: hypothetical protein DWH86_03585 [Planctomycetota bacterium]
MKSAATATTPTSAVKRARPQLNVYTGLLVVALLMAIFGTAVVAMMNMDVTGKGPFDMASTR